MTPVYPTTTIYAYISSAWLDITPYQIGQISGFWGINGNKPTDFVAGTGMFQFDLNNQTGRFSPNNPARFSTDWKKNAKIKLVISFGGDSRVLFGTIKNFAFGVDTVRNVEKITVYVADWMDKAAKFPISYPDVLINATSDDGVTALVTSMPIAPLAQSLAVGVNTFPALFDDATDFTYLTTELSKICLSELCYAYLRKDGVYGETFVLENADSRANPVNVEIPVTAEDSGALLKEDGGFLLKEDGGQILLNQATTFESVDDALSYEVSDGDNLINDVRFRFTARQVGFTLLYDGPVTIDSTHNDPVYGPYPVLETLLDVGETKTIISQWGNFNKSYYCFERSFFNDGSINRYVVSPIPASSGMATNTKMFDGPSPLLAGTNDITSDLQEISFEAWADRFKLVIKNNNATKRGYVLLILANPSCYNIILYPSTQVVVQDAASIAANDYAPLTFDQIYQIDAVAGTAFANAVLAAEAQPRTTINRINYNANRSAADMIAFLKLDVGDCFYAKDTIKGAAGNVFVQNMSFTIDPGEIVNYSIGVRHIAPVPPVVVSSANQSGAGVSSITWNHTTAAGSNGLLMVNVALRGSDTVNSVTATVGGVTRNLTKFDAAEQGNTGGDPRIEMWYLLAPTVGTNAIVVNTTASSYVQAVSVYLTGANQSAPFGIFASANGTGTTATVTALSSTADLIIDILSTYATVTKDASQTELFNISSDGSWRGAGSTKPGAASVVMSWTLGTSQKWQIGAVAIKPV